MNNSREELKRKVMADAVACNACNRCFHSCPLPPGRKVKARRVLDHLASEEPPTGDLKEFVLQCNGCGHCDNSCPLGLKPHLMLRWEKAKYPSMPYPKFMRVRGARLKTFERLVVRAHNLSRRRGLGVLAPYMDNDPAPAPFLFYFACYLFSPTCVAAGTLDLARRLELDFAVLGGMRHCCGYVHRMTGQLETADAMYEDLGNTLVRMAPETIITGCAECYRGLREIVALRGLTTEVLGVEAFVLRYWSDLGLPSRLPGRVAYHHGCQADDAIRLENVLDLVPTPGYCCGLGAGEYDREQNMKLREAELAVARELGLPLMVDCVSCREKFMPSGLKAGINVTDLVSMVCAYLENEEKKL